MPPAFSSAIDGAPIGPKAGSCGTAAWRGEPVEVTDIAQDPLWEDYRALALPLGLAACWSSPIKDRDGKVVATFALYYREPRGANPFHRQMVEACVHLCTLAIAHDTSQAQIHRLAYYDDLTGLPNRVLLRDRAHQMIHQAQHDNRSAVMMFLDLDRFKNVNDSLGHIVGDQVLQQVSQRLAHCLHDVDTICRLGGDEFALLLPNCDEHGATQVAQRLQRSLQDGLDISGMTLIPTISIGICLYPFDAGDFESLLKNADIALHQAKIAGKNRFHFFRKQMNDAVTRRLEMEVALRQAILQQQLTIHFQPQLRLNDQSLHGAEVLVRWRHPQLGQVPPNEFIPLAEECGLINQLDNWVLNAACQQLADWDRRGIRVPKLSVNISSVQFLHEDVPQIVAAELRRHGLSSERLCLEITEGVMMAESGAILQAMHDLQTMGITLSVDDFGTGYSSLGYLKRFPVAELKLDRSFVNDLEHNDEARALSNAIVRIGESLRLAVVAEGIETAGQLALLNQANCDIGQGYYFSRPLPAAEFEAWMQQHGL
jgi:diguanylate cyclase (GGDEF)-like protein